MRWPNGKPRVIMRRPGNDTIDAVALAPDDRHAAVSMVSYTRSGTYVISLDSPRPKLALLRAYGTPVWTPDGHYLLTQGANGDIVRLDTRTGKVKHLGHGYNIAVSRDGQRVAYISGQDHHGSTCYEDGCGPNGEVYVMNIDGAGRRRITNDIQGEDFVAWTAGGALLASRSLTENDGYDVVVRVDLETGASTPTGIPGSAKRPRGLGPSDGDLAAQP